MLTSSIFGGSVASAIPNGATSKSVSLSTNGVVLDVQEQGVFGIYSYSIGGAFDLSVEIDGNEFSGPYQQIIYAMIAATGTSGFYSSNIPYYKSLKITISNHLAGGINVDRISL